MPNDITVSIAASEPIHRIDKSALRERVEQLAELPADWNGHGAEPIDPGVIASALGLVDRLPEMEISTPQVVPMTRGRLQFEWHRGRRSLELEVEDPTLVHYLKYDADHGIEEEETLSIGEASALIGLVRWFHGE